MSTQKLKIHLFGGLSWEITVTNVEYIIRIMLTQTMKVKNYKSALENSYKKIISELHNWISIYKGSIYLCVSLGTYLLVC